MYMQQEAAIFTTYRVKNTLMHATHSIERRAAVDLEAVLRNLVGHGVVLRRGRGVVRPAEAVVVPGHAGGGQLFSTLMKTHELSSKKTNHEIFFENHEKSI